MSVYVLYEHTHTHIFWKRHAKGPLCDLCHCWIHFLFLPVVYFDAVLLWALKCVVIRSQSPVLFINISHSSSPWSLFSALSSALRCHSWSTRQYSGRAHVPRGSGLWSRSKLVSWGHERVTLHRHPPPQCRPGGGFRNPLGWCHEALPRFNAGLS